MANTMVDALYTFLVILVTIASPTSTNKLTAFTQAWVISPTTERQNPISNRAVNWQSPSASSPSITTWLCSNSKKDTAGNSCLHSSIVSPRRADVGGSIDDDDIDDFVAQNSGADLRKQQEELSKLFRLLQAEPQGLLHFENEDDSGVRGMYTNRSVQSGEVVLKLPLDSCVTDDQTPSWLPDEVKNDPHRWATRLAASWIDLHLKDKQFGSDGVSSDSSQNERSREGHKVWSSLLPDPEYLRASLPVHWPETTILNARSTALELAVDSAFFARAEAVNDLIRGIQRSPHVELFSKEDEVAMHRRMSDLSHHALNLVQTRSCRLEDDIGLEDQDCRRALAPIFDFINHGSRNTDSANAYFTLEEMQDESLETPKREYLVVRSIKDIPQDEEIKLDYGTSARPAWKCLLSYGFVPSYKRTTKDAEEGENLAEVYMKGVRYEVADDSVPIDMVADATPRPRVDEDDDEPQSDENVLTPEIALRIAERIADAAYYLLLEPEQILDEHESNAEEDDVDTIPPTPFEVISKQLAASLRWSQHRILLTCAAGLTHFAKEHIKEEESSYQ